MAQMTAPRDPRERLRCSRAMGKGGTADGQHKVSLRCQASFVELGDWEQLRAKAHGKGILWRGCQDRAIYSVIMRSRQYSSPYLCKQSSL